MFLVQLDVYNFKFILAFNDNKKVSTNERLYRDGLDRQKNKMEKAE